MTDKADAARRPRARWPQVRPPGLGGGVRSLLNGVLANIVAAGVGAALLVGAGYALKHLWAAAVLLGFLVVGGGVAVIMLRVRLARRLPSEAAMVDAPAGGPLLPPDILDFVGRDDDLEALRRTVDEVPAVAVVGPREVGTSVFVLHAAHQLLAQSPDRFPDGQLYLDVRGARQARRATPARVLREALRHLGLPEPRPGRADDLDLAANVLHGWLADKRYLLVLDNVDDPELVSRLLPRAPGCCALLAGSAQLRQLGGVHCLELTNLDDDEAIHLLATVRGGPFHGGDLDAARELVRRVNGRPLAIRLLGQRLREHRWRPADVLAAINRPDATHDPMKDLLDLSYRHLGRVQRRIFRLLALVPATEIDAGAIAELAHVGHDRATVELDELVRGGLLESAAPGRYRLRQHLDDSARDRLAADEPRRRRRRAQVRLARYCATAAQERAEALLPTPAPEPGRRAADPPAEYGNWARAEAMAWFGREHELLYQLVVGWTDDRSAPESLAVQRWRYRLAVALSTWYAEERRLGDWADVCTAVLGMRLARRNPRIGAWAHNELGVIHRLRSAFDEAMRDFDEAERLLRRRRSGRAQVLTNASLVLLSQGRPYEALRRLDEARRRRARRDRRGLAITHLALGVAYWRCGQPVEAGRALADAENAFRDLGEDRGLAAALNNLGLVLSVQGEEGGARERWALAEELYRQLGDGNGLARVMLNEAVSLLAGADADLSDVARTLNSVVEQSGGQQPSVTEGLGLLHLGDIADRRGHAQLARQHWEQARTVLSRVNAPEAVEAAHRLDT
jgi:tetratricopeptide (TPR) repeat protein